MSKRAALRREYKARNKINKKAKTGDMGAIAQQLFVKGYDQGVTVSTAIIFMALNELYGFSHMNNGRGKLDKLMEKIREEASKMNSEPTRFNCEYYVRMLSEQTGLLYDIDFDSKTTGATL